MIIKEIIIFKSGLKYNYFCFVFSYLILTVLGYYYSCLILKSCYCLKLQSKVDMKRLKFCIKFNWL